MDTKTKPRKPHGAKPAAAAQRKRSAAVGQATVRHYCQGIGDCHLLTFPRKDGTSFHMLIDCGVHSAVSGGSELIRRIVADIAHVTRHIDVLVVTHEHMDHLSGFLTAADKFKDIEVGQVWMAWTEDPADAQARALDKFKSQAVAALQAASCSLDRHRNATEHLSAVRDGLHALLGFQFGASGEKVRAARDAAAALAGRKGVTYLEPTQKPMALEGVDNLRIYVLGPPRDEKLLGVMARASEMYGLAGGETWPMAAALQGALGVGEAGQDDGAPFDFNLGSSLSAALEAAPGNRGGPAQASLQAFLQAHYAGPEAVGPGERDRARKGRRSATGTDQAWRRIDADWLGVSADLALQLDNRTNNTSLVLAFEFVDSGRVMLFAADAQVGNWLSWQDLRWGDVTGPDLLARTVYYKVGHHGSQNATLKAKGLELMTSADLSAFIPTNAKDAKKVRWGEMPFPDIVEELDRRTHGRLIRADDPWMDGPDHRPFQTPIGSLREVRYEPGLWVEVEVA